MRHGKVRLEGRGEQRISNVRDAVSLYDHSPVSAPEGLDFAEFENAWIVCSDLSRSRESALLAFGRFDETDRHFREAESPDVSISPVRARVPILIGVARGLWLLGRSKGCESFRQFRTRCERAAEKLIAYDTDGQDVILVGHGVLNRYIASALRQRGYAGPRVPGSVRWGRSRYERV